jgi:hypothetical protein
MSAVRSQVGVLPSPRSSSEKKDPGLRVFSGYSCVPIFIHTSSPALRCQTTYAAPPRDRHVVTKLPLALATKAKSQRAESALLCASVVASLGSAPRGASGRLPLSGGWVFGGCGCVAGHAPCEESWLVHASQPQSTHTLPCLVCYSVLIYNTREAPCSSLGGLSGRSLRRTLRVQVVA